VFKFDRLDELKAWLRSPRVVEYDEEGPVQRRTGNAGRKTVKPGGLSQ
jgi:antibiotic biosynthesis monooxygenase (ABM) superfamily enzyme